MSSARKIRVACIGAGWVARAGHCPSLCDIEQVELAGVCDLDRERAESVARDFGFPAAYSDYRAMLEQAAPDAVYVLLPPQAMDEVVCCCLAAGLDLLVEKPPGMTADQTRVWARLAEQKDCRTMVAFNRRFIPILVESRRIVEQCAPIHQCAVTYVKDYQRSYDPHRFGGCEVIFLDAIHAIDALRWLGGEVADVHSAVRAVEGQGPNTFAAVLEFASGTVGLLNASWAAGARVHTFELHAVGASAYVDTNNRARILTRGSTEPLVLDAREVAGSDQFHRYYGFLDENRHFVDCILNGKLPQTHLGDAVRTMELCEAIMRRGWR